MAPGKGRYMRAGGRILRFSMISPPQEMARLSHNNAPRAAVFSVAAVGRICNPRAGEHLISHHDTWRAGGDRVVVLTRQHVPSGIAIAPRTSHAKNRIADLQEIAVARALDET